MTDTTKQTGLAAFPLEEMGYEKAADDLTIFGMGDWRLTVGDIRAARATPVSPAQSIDTLDLPDFWKLVRDYGKADGNQRIAAGQALLDHIAQWNALAPTKPQSEHTFASLRSAIMNLPCKPVGYVNCPTSHAQGHRDARHAAAELVAASVGAQVAGKPVAGLNVFADGDWNLVVLTDSEGKPEHTTLPAGYYALYTAPAPAPATVPDAEYVSVMEWDRPNSGLYDDGSIRIITSRRRSDRQVGACHKASDEEVRWVLTMEAAAPAPVAVAPVAGEGLTEFERCTHPDCGRFKDGAGWGCRAMIDNACARPGWDGQAERQPQPAAQAAVPEGYPEPLSEFQEGQWWVKELDAMVARTNATEDQVRAVAVVHHMLKAAAVTLAAPAAVPQQPSAAHAYAAKCVSDELRRALEPQGVEAQKGGA